MQRSYLLACVRVSLVAAAIASMLASSHDGLADEPAPAKQPAKQVVEVKLWVIEVSKTKLRSLGFDWGILKMQPELQKKPSGDISSEQFQGYLEALDQNNLARTLAKPMIATRSGQKAVIDISPHLKLEVTPKASDAEHIDFAYHIDVATDPDAGRFVSGSSTELKSGVAQLLSETTIQRRTAKGEPTQSAIFVFAQATIVK